MISDESWPPRRPALWEEDVSAGPPRPARRPLMTLAVSESAETLPALNDRPTPRRSALKSTNPRLELNLK